jgi:hypothetical protein
MAKLELKGVFTEVGAVRTVGEKETRIQDLMFLVPAYRDGYGEVKGDDEVWNVQVMGKRIDDLKLDATFVGKKAKLTCFANSKTFTKDGKTSIFVNISLGSLELAQVNA